jgi:hypothetical protein
MDGGLVAGAHGVYAIIQYILVGYFSPLKHFGFRKGVTPSDPN